MIRHIKINRLNITLKGVSPEAARAAVGDLGAGMLQELVGRKIFNQNLHQQSQHQPNQQGGIDGSGVTAIGTITPTPRSQSLQHKIAAKTVDAISAHLRGTGKKEGHQ